MIRIYTLEMLLILDFGIIPAMRLNLLSFISYLKIIYISLKLNYKIKQKNLYHYI